MNTRTLLIGIDGEQTVNSETTQKQIDEIMKLDCSLIDQEESAITWKDVNNTDEPRTIFQSILRDRKMRVDQHTLMADRPSFSVVTALENRAVRLEYYEGHDALKLEYDIRSAELQDKELPDYMTADPQAYDPSKFLKDAFGIPEEVSKPLLDEAHK